jgi:hypothetical protein
MSDDTPPHEEPIRHWHPLPGIPITEAATAAGRDRRTIRRWLDAGRFPNAYRTATGEWRIPPNDLLIAGLRLHAPTPPDVEQQPPARAPEPDVEALRIERDEWRRRAEVAEAVAAERAEALADARLALRALTSSEPPRAPEPAVVVEPQPPAPAVVDVEPEPAVVDVEPEPAVVDVEQPRRRRWRRRR